jgi:hypothetical protein
MNDNHPEASDQMGRFAPVEVRLKNPPVAALLAWLWPGAGHIYQGRTGKGVLFMVCILVIYFWGLAMGGGHVVYASLKKPDIRYPYPFQLGVGLPAMPAMVQAVAAKSGKDLFGNKFMAPPGDRTPNAQVAHMSEQQHDELATWHEKYGFYFEMGTLYTMIAGLLNMLVIYDAYGGPLFTDPRKKTATIVDEKIDADETAVNAGKTKTKG